MNPLLPFDDAGTLPFETPEAAPRFDGETYDHTRDHVRLGRQSLAVWAFMSDQRWHTLREGALYVGCSEGSFNARLRDFRKQKFGSHTVERRRYDTGLHEYRVVPSGARMTGEDGLEVYEGDAP